MTENIDTSTYVNRSIDVDSTITDEATLGDAHGPDQGDVGVRIEARDVTIYVEPSCVDRTLRLSSYVTFTNEGDPIDTGDRIEVIGYLQVGSLGDATRIAEAIELGFQADAEEALRLAELTSSDGDFEGDEPTPVEATMTITPPGDNADELAAAVTGFVNRYDELAFTRTEFAYLGRLGEAAMAAQAHEHTVELHRAWELGKAAGARPLPSPIYGDDHDDRREPTNPYPETTPASAEVIIDGDIFTLEQLPAIIARQRAQIRELTNDTKQGYTDALERRARTVVLDEVSDERDRQVTKWGHQQHPTGTGPETTPLVDLPWRKAWHDGRVKNLSTTTAKTLAACATENTDLAASNDAATWSDILLEEVFEALAEAAPEGLRHELIQVAAVAVQIAEEIDAGQIAEPQ